MTTSSLLAAIPGPSPTPLFGWRGNRVRFFLDPIAYMDPLREAFGDVVSVARGGGGPLLLSAQQAQGTVFAFGSECNQAVLSQMSRFHSVRLHGPPESRPFERISSGLFNMNGEKHRQQRRLLQPAFHKKQLESYRDVMVSHTAHALEHWKVGETRDLAAELQRLTLAISNRALFGVETTAREQSLGGLIAEQLSLTLSPGTLLPAAVPFTPRRRMVALAARVEQHLRAVIADKRRIGAEQGDVLTTLLAATDEEGARLTEDELLGQLFVLFFAAYDTTRSALSWTLFLLSQHPKVMAELGEELDGTLRGEPPGVEHLGQLPLLERVLKESLRLFTPAPFVLRLTTTPLELAGRALPEGTEVVLSYYHSHRVPELYPEPQRFRPERWEGFSPSPYDYVPFGAGARMCIGAGFAMMEMKIVLAMLLQRFQVELVPGARVDRNVKIVLSPKQGLPMRLRPRQQSAGRPPARVRGNVHQMVALRS
jgi:cytochrome P450